MPIIRQPTTAFCGPPPAPCSRRAVLKTGAAALAALATPVGALAASGPRHRVAVETFGARGVAWDTPEGQAPDTTAAIRAAIAHLSAQGGGELSFRSHTAYRIDDPIAIRSSDIRLVGNGCRLLGKGRFVVSGDIGRAGDYTQAVTGFAMTDFVFSGSAMGPMLRFCTGYELGGLTRDNQRGTWINIHHCRDGYVHDCDAQNGEKTKIAYLVLGGQNNLLERCRISGGEWVYGFQLKGGRNNWARDCAVENVPTMTHAFRLRGDAPWRDSQTTGTYPYADGDWQSPDPRRATRDSGFVSCTARNCAGVHFLATEFADCAIVDCHSDSASQASAARIALFAYRQAGGGERGLRIEGFRADAPTGSGIVLHNLDPEGNFADVVAQNCSVTNAGDNGLEARNVGGLNLDALHITGARQDGIVLRDCARWRVTDPQISRCAVGLRVAFTPAADQRARSGQDRSGTLIGAAGLAGNRIADSQIAPG